MPRVHPIMKLISQGEGLCLDFKFEISDARKIARSLVAFANTEGGRLLVGVKDNGRIAGVRSDEEYYMVESAAQRFCEPEVAFGTSEWDIGGKRVLEIVVQPSATRPHKAPDKDGLMKAYIRVGDQNLLANRVMMEVWRHQREDKGITIEYKEAEAALMGLLGEGECSVSAFMKRAVIPYRIAVRILVKFILLGVVRMRQEEGGAWYSLAEESLSL